MPKIQFGSLDAANRIRNNPQYQGFVANSDNARTKTVELKKTTPEPALADIQGEAADTTKHKAEQYGQAELTKSEKKKLDFSQTNVPHARSAKAIAQGKGVDDWTSFYDETLSVDEHRDVFKSARKDDRGRRGLGNDRESEEEIDRRMAQAHHVKRQEELPKAKEHAFSGDKDARGLVRDAGSRSEVFDISLSTTDTGGFQGSGQDFSRLEDHHESRSKRAQTLDEKQTAPITRDPFTWQDDPDQYDFPGIDTVEPEELHSERSPHAQAIDERERAPVTEDRQKWAMNPDRWDFPGVDTPDNDDLDLF